MTVILEIFRAARFLRDVKSHLLWPAGGTGPGWPARQTRVAIWEPSSEKCWPRHPPASRESVWK